jgi:hypothetical protein
MTVAIGFLALIALCFVLYLLLFRCKNCLVWAPSRQHSLLRGSDHGDGDGGEGSEQIVFEDFMGRSSILPNPSRKSYQLAPGIEFGPLHPRARGGEDDDDILEITL